jgi:hypothetical protein
MRIEERVVRWMILPLFALAACAHPETQRKEDTGTKNILEPVKNIPDPAPRCGDEKIDPGEQCELAIGLQQTCLDLGYAGGALRCQDCRIDTSGCVLAQPKNGLPDREYHRRGGRGSCPYVYLWDGKEYHYATDLSGSVLAKGMDFLKPKFYGPNLYELENFHPQGGLYRIKAREVIFEASFFDAAALLLVDVPEGFTAHTTWSFTSQLLLDPSREFVSVQSLRPPIAAWSGDGLDVREAVSDADGIPLPVREDSLSQVVVDFGPLDHPEHAKLILTTWGVYADFRDRQRPPFSAGTTIETRGTNGKWQVRRVGGKSAGDARTWALDIGGLLPHSGGEMRITLAHMPSVLDVLDAVRLDDSEPVPIQVSRVTPRFAELQFGGAARVVSSSLGNRTQADDSRLPLIPDAILSGRYTRTGDVCPLLLHSDDRFVVMGHGDELLLGFDDPPQAPGTKRTVFLEADVFYSLKFHPFGQVTDTNEPMPFHGMERYPYDPVSWPYLDDPAYHEYQRTWNTRVVREPDLPRSP